MATPMQLIASVAIAVMSAVVVSAAPPQDAIPPDCSAVLPAVMSCLTYVQMGSNQPDPGKMCCSGVGTVMTKTPQCLCVIITNARSFNPPIDMARLLDLPKVCSIDIPVPTCDDSRSPKAAPNASSTSQTPSPAPSPANKNSTSGAAGRCGGGGGRSMAVAGLAAAVVLSALAS